MAWHSVVILWCLEDQTSYKQHVSYRFSESKFQEKMKKVITCGCHKNKPQVLMQ